LIESELFGHEKGAFTGASQRKSGRFEQARGGTLFLDEIGDMPIEAQTRLLRVLQEGEFTSVGGREAISADVRIVAATHRNLRQLVNQGLFREDLFYRLNVVPIRLPPLRERRDDIALLMRHFLSTAASEADLPQKTMTTDALNRLNDYRWPGNVRELENLARRLVALHADDSIDEWAVTAELSEGAETTAPIADLNALTPATSEGGLSFAVEKHLCDYFAAHGDDLPPAGLYGRILKEIERPLLSVTLAATRGNQIKAAGLLGLNRNTLRKKMKDHEIEADRSMGQSSGRP
jgi:two-component system nitrogen regulation response regulator GlnG